MFKWTKKIIPKRNLRIKSRMKRSVAWPWSSRKTVENILESHLLQEISITFLLSHAYISSSRSSFEPEHSLDLILPPQSCQPLPSPRQTLKTETKHFLSHCHNVVYLVDFELTFDLNMKFLYPPHFWIIFCKRGVEIMSLHLKYDSKISPWPRQETC